MTEDRLVFDEDLGIEVVEDDEEYLEQGYPYDEELDFDKDPVTEYVPEPEDDYDPDADYEEYV